MNKRAKVGKKTREEKIGCGVGWMQGGCGVWTEVDEEH